MVLAVYGWLTHPLALAGGICLLGLCKSPVPSLVVALAQDSAASGRVGAASGLIMSMHYVAALTTPVAMGRLITWLDSMTLAMLLGSALAFTTFGYWWPRSANATDDAHNAGVHSAGNAANGEKDPRIRKRTGMDLFVRYHPGATAFLEILFGSPQIFVAPQGCLS